MEKIIWNVVEKLSDIVLFDVVPSDNSDEIKNTPPERVTIVYPTSLTKDFHYFEYQGERIKYSAEIFKIENAKQFELDSIPLARAYGSVLYLLFSATDEAEKFVKKALEIALPYVMQFAKEKAEHNFKVAFANAVQSRVEEYNSRITANSEAAEQKATEILELHRQIQQDREAFQALDGTKGQWKQRAESEFGHLMKLIPNLYSRIYLQSDYLVAETHEVQINYEGYTYDIGEFEVRIKLATGDLEIKNTTHQVEEHDHPHIVDGAACLGNIGPGVIRMLAEFELFGALQAIHTFLHSYNPSSPYLKIEYWNEDYQDEEDNRYEACRDDHSGYDCIECGGEDGRCPFYENAFQDCFNASTLDDCIGCEYQCHLGRERIRQHQVEVAVINE